MTIYKVSIFKDTKSERTEIGLKTNQGMVLFVNDYDTAFAAVENEIKEIENIGAKWFHNSTENEVTYSVNIAQISVNDKLMTINWVYQSIFFTYEQ